MLRGVLRMDDEQVHGRGVRPGRARPRQHAPQSARRRRARARAARSSAAAGTSLPASRTPRPWRSPRPASAPAARRSTAPSSPAATTGKTPPCADALVAAGVARAVVALGDPNPLVDGRGLSKLREGGVEVDLAEDRWGARAREQNAPFLKFHGPALPLVTYKAAVTLDGKVAAAGGDARWISCLDSRRAVHELRAARRRGHGRRRHGAPRRPRADGAARRGPRPRARRRHARRRPAAGRQGAGHRASHARPSSSRSSADGAARSLLEARGAELHRGGGRRPARRARGARRARPARHPLRRRPHARRRACWPRG